MADFRLVAPLLLTAIAGPVAAQTAQAAVAPATTEVAAEDEAEEIVVTGQRQRGAVIGDIEPELQLNAGDVRALGVSSIADLLTELAPQLRSDQGSGGPPVVLLEGRRISGFREVAQLPAEAIARVDILPEEVALKYGYPSSSKVLNIVLRQRFRAFTVEAADRIATRGGANRPQGEFDFLRIWRDGRFNIDADYQSTAALTERQRGIASLDGSSRYRTLIPANEQLTLSATYNRRLGEDVQATLNGQYVTDDTRATFGLPVLAVPDPSVGPQQRTTDTQTAHLATTVSGSVDKWQWTFTGNYDRVTSDTAIARGPTLATDTGRSRSDTGAIDFALIGSPLRLLAGELSTTAKIGATFVGLDSAALRSGVATRGSVNRDIADGQLSIDVPIASRRGGVLDFAGDLSVNGNLAVRKFSDFGTLTTWGAGTTWSLIEPLSLIASYTDDEQAPSPEQLGNPVVADPNVRVFDYTHGVDAFVTRIGGGNPFLLPSERRTLKIGGTLTPFDKTDLSLTATYLRARTTNVIGALPPTTPQVEAAFPDRFVRDGSGALVRVDARTVNYDRRESSELRWGFNFSKPLKTSQAQADALRAAFQRRFPNGPPGRDGAGPPRGPGERGGPGGRGGGGGGRGGFGGGGGRLTFSAYHTWHFEDRVRFRPGLPVIDLLDGGSIGTGGGGGQPRHEVEVQAGASKNGFGFRATGNWQSATRVDGFSGSDDLRFGDIATFDLRLFANVGQQPWVLTKAPWLAGTRVTVSVDNVFDAQQRVTDASGVTPFAYQPGYVDPLGRTIRISIRKQFFSR